MSAHQKLPVRHRSALITTIGAAGVAVLLGAFAYLLLDSQALVRKASEKRFQTRAAISAALTESLFATAAAEGQKEAAKRFGERAVDSAALTARVKRSKLVYGLILGSDGTVLAASPGIRGYARRYAASRPKHIREALKGRPYLSGVLPGASRKARAIEWAMPFKTAFGRRIQVSGFNAKPLTRFLSSYLARAPESPDMKGYVIDERGRVIAAGGRPREQDGRLDRALSSALAGDRHGTFRAQGGAERYFASAPVVGSSWRVVVSEPTSDLYPILAKGRTWVLWTVLAAFALAAAVCLFLLRRLLRSAAQLGEANKQLLGRQQELALTNERLEEQTKVAQDANLAKSKFLANMSHELRTPLTAIVGFSELLKAGTAGETEAERKEFLDYIVVNGRHLEGLINDILDLSKVEAGKMEFKPERVDLADLVGDLTRTMSVIANKSQIELATEVAPDVQAVVSDPAKLKQVLYNYLSNALKFTPDGGRILVRAAAEDGESFRLAVEDSGIGIAPEDQSKLFHHFQQLDQTAGKEHQGTGLGLALVKRIVEAQGGRVGVHSVPGEGSVFYAVLPRGQWNGTAAHQSESTRTGQSA